MSPFYFGRMEDHSCALTMHLD